MTLKVIPKQRQVQSWSNRGPISVHVTTEEIKEALTDYNVISVDRLKKKVNKNRIDSTVIKLTFETSDIPADIRIECSYYKV